MQQARWPKLPHTNPSDLREHAESLGDAFKAVQQFLQTGLSDVAPTLPKGIEHKIKEGIARGLVQEESHDYSTTCISVHDDRDLICNAIYEEINAKTAAAFHNRVPQYLFKILQGSYDDLCLKITSQENAPPKQGARMARTASENGIMPETPPESSPEESESTFSVCYGSDTEALIHHDWYKDENRLEVQESKLNARLQEVERERKVGSQKLKEKANSIKKELQEVVLEREAVDKRVSESLKAMEAKRSERDRTGDYGTEDVGYMVDELSDLFYGKQDSNSRCVTLGIESQATVNRLFNMPANVLTRKVSEAAGKKGESVGAELFPTITHYLGAELLDDGNVLFWATSTDDYHFENHKIDAFDSLSNILSWDQAIFTSFASHLTESSETCAVEVKDITVEMVELRDRKHKAAVITSLVKHNLTTLPTLHIDLIKDIRFSRRTTNDNTRALVLDFSDAATANEVIRQGLQWDGRNHPCEIFDIKFLDRCGCCQVYGHHSNTCSSPPRCGNCAERHRTKFCRSSYTRCALCDESHRVGSSRCRAKRARLLDKHNARFLLEQNQPSDATPSKEPKGASPPVKSPEMQFPATEVEHVNVTKERPANSGSIPVQSTFSFALLSSARQLQDRLPALEAAMQSLSLGRAIEVEIREPAIVI